jgi:single-stranded-DNA-specific exonuclease
MPTSAQYSFVNARSHHAAKTAAPKPPPARWRIKTSPTAADTAIAAACGISPIIAAILRLRGYSTKDQIDSFFNPTAGLLRDPMQLPDIQPAIERLHHAITNKEPLLIFGDYDVDGVTSTALLVRSLRALGANIDYTVPEREDGYGLSVRAVELAKANGTTLIITADCGITAHEPVQRARELGIDVIVTDHHDPQATLPAALAVINPKRADSTYGFRELCGCAVAFKVIQALLQQYWPRHSDAYWNRFVELVGLASVADCVPLIDENRYLAREGLRCLATTNKQGIQALIKSSGMKITGESLTGSNVGFVLGPRLNAAGRIASPRKSLDLLLSTDADECEVLAAALEAHNRERQALTSRVALEAFDLVEKEVDQLRDPIIVEAAEGWSHGVIGLAASRLVDRYGRPAIVLGVEDGIAKGSGRSVDGFDLHGLLEATRPLLTTGGGHAMACGLSLPHESFADFRLQALQHAREKLKLEDLVPVVEADCAVTGREITPQLIREMEQLEPCGTGNPEALLMLKSAVIADGRAIGSEGQHLKWQVQADGQMFDAVWWRPGEKADGFGIGKTVDICFAPQFNTWNGRTSVQLIVKDARVCRER